MNILWWLIDKMTVATGKICSWMTLAMMVLILYESFMRYVLRNAPMISDEISSYMLVFLAFVGLAYTWKGKGHVVIDILTIRLSASVVHRLRIITLVIALVCSILLTKLGFDFIIRTVNMHIYSDSWLRIPQAWPRGFVFIGFLILSLQLIDELVKITKSPDKK